MVLGWLDWVYWQGSFYLHIFTSTFPISEWTFGEVGDKRLFFSMLALTLDHGDMV